MNKTNFKNIIGVLIFLAAGNTAWAQDPNSVIQSAADELAAALDGRKDALAENKDELYELIDGVLLPRFDRRYAAQLVLGRHWRNASNEQRTRFIDAFYSSLLRRYADGVLEFDQNRIEILPFRGDLECRVRARTRLEEQVEH